MTMTARSFLIALLFGAPAFASPIKTEKWTLHNDATTFVGEIGKVCLASKSAKIEVIEGGIEVTDTPGCVAELKRMALHWDKFPNLPVAAVRTLSINNAKIVREALKKSAPADMAVDTGVLGPRHSCPCLAFMEGHAKELSLMAQKIIDKNNISE